MGNNMRKSQRGWPGGEQGERHVDLGPTQGAGVKPKVWGPSSRALNARLKTLDHRL